MRPLSESTSRILGQNFERKYVSLGRIVNSWTEIVGEKLADKALPVKIHYRKQKDSKKPEASLDVAVSSAHATLLHYQKDLILERINQIFGERWINSIRFVSVPANEENIFVPREKKTPLTESQKKTLSDILESFPDEEMKERLNRLGAGIMTKEQ